MAEMVRKHFTIPRELAEEFERRVGQRNQSEKLAELLALWLRNQRLGDVTEKHAGFATAEAHPEWATAEDVSKWVRELRAREWEHESSALSLRESRED